MPKKRKYTSSYSSDMHKKPSFSSKLTQKDIENVEALFDKHYSYTSMSSLPVMDHAGGKQDSDFTVEDWIGENPTLTNQVHPDKELMILKHELNATKDLLSSQDIDTWHVHTTNCNMAAKVIPYVKSLNVELCTQAWVKFCEILSKYQIVPQQAFFSVHLCEAPGAFVASLNYYLQQKAFKHKWNWRATTLNPYYEANTMGEMIADDRLIKNTYSHWFFGKDDSGDITADNHVKDLCSMLQRVMEEDKLSPLLVTADGSKDCQTNPAEQESLLSRLHYCEMISACLILAKDGCFVFKVFTMLEPATVTLMFLLNVMFMKVHVTKPATSKSGNSETYLVCLNFKKNVSEETLWKLLDLTVYNNKADSSLTFLKEIPVDFLQEHLLCCQNFTRWQMQTIKHNLELYDDKRPEMQYRLEEMQVLALDNFVTLTGVCHIHHYRALAESYRKNSALSLKDMSWSQQTHTRPDWHHKNLKGTFHLRQNLSNMSWEERIMLMDVRDNLQPNMSLQSSYSIQDDDEVIEWLVVGTGRNLSLIENSRLCSLDLMKDLTLLMTNLDFQRYRQSLYMEHAAILGKMLSDLVSDSSTCTSANTSRSVIYLISSKQEKDCLTYKYFTNNFKNTDHIKHICTEDDFSVIASSSEQHVQIVCDMTSFCDELNPHNSNYDELTCKKKFMKLITKLLKHLQRCRRLILLTSSFLSRLNAGILYILARSFYTTTIKCEANLWLHQFVVLDDYLGVGPTLINHLTDTTDKLIDSEVNNRQTTVTEVLKFSSLLNDRKFVQFVTAYNNFTVTGFINKMLHHYKKLQLQPVTEQDNKKCT